MKISVKCLAVFSVFVCILSISVSEDDLYKLLGVKKTSSSKDIKKAYKQLARELHPDKNLDDPNASEQFMKINEAYETLSDPEKRRDYDNFGRTAGDIGQRDQRGYGGGGFHGFETFFGGGFGGFRGGGDSNLDKHRLNIRVYTNKVVPESYAKPYLLYAYADFCFMCMQVEGIWDRFRGDLETIGLGAGTVHVHMDQPVARKLRISGVPAFVAIVNGKVVYYNKRQFSVQGLRDFVRGLVSSSSVTTITDSNYKSFLSGWKDNKVRMIFCDKGSTLSLRFLYATYANRDRVMAGYVQLDSSSSESFRKNFGVKSTGETFLMFNEETASPVADINMKTIPRNTMDQVIDGNSYLLLPRLSSQIILDTLCPAKSSMRKKTLCVVLLCRNVPDHEDYLSTFRKYAQDHLDPEERVKYTYIWEDTQKHFVRELTKGASIVNETAQTLKVAVIWRKDKETFQYDWLEEGWHLSDGDLMRSRRQLHQLVDWLLISKDILPQVMVMPELTDEHLDRLFVRIFNRVLDWRDSIWDLLLNIDEVTMMTAMITVVFIVVIGFMMKSLVTAEEEKVTRHRGDRRHQSQENRAQPPVVSVHPLCSTNFVELLLKSEPGVRTIVVLVDLDSRHKLLQDFVSVLLPYSRSKAFHFAFLQLEDYLPWYKQLLEFTCENTYDLSNINMKNCIGTVLAINGPRKYYCIYHARARQTKSGKTGQFMGFDTDESDFSDDPDKDAQKLFHSDLLSGFGTWMERLLEGSLKRFRVNVWPNMSNM